MSDWVVTSGNMEVRERNDELFINAAAINHFNELNMGPTDTVFRPPMIFHESTGFDDLTAAYLNAIFYLPNADVQGIPPVELIGADAEGLGVEGAPRNISEKDVEELKELPSSYRRRKQPGEELHTGGMIALIPDAESAAKLAVPGGDPMEELHVTLWFMPDAIMFTEPQRDIIRAVLNSEIVYGMFQGLPITANVAGTGTLGGEDAKVYLIGDSFPLKMMRDDTSRMVGQMVSVRDSYRLAMDRQREPWIAHLTAGYGDSVALSDMTYRGEVKFDRVRLALGETYTDFSLTDGGSSLPDDMLEYLGSDPAITESMPDVEPSLKSLLEDEDIPYDIKMIMMSMGQEAVVEEAYNFLYGTKESGSKQPGAAKLRRYWTRDPRGRAKIGWGAPGDFLRCVSHLEKYVGPGAKGLCAIYHKAALGVWPGREGGKSFDWAKDDYFVALRGMVFDTNDEDGAAL